MQRSHSTEVRLRIHIHASSQALFDGFNVSVECSIKQCFNFFTCIAAVFAEEVGNFGMFVYDGPI